MTAVSAGNAEHYHWGRDCDGWHLPAADDLSIIEERMSAGATEQRHRHVRARQFFYVLEGEAVLEVDGPLHCLHRGEGLHVPPGAAHQMRNDSGADSRFLVVSAPRSHGDRVAAPADTGA